MGGLRVLDSVVCDHVSHRCICGVCNISKWNPGCNPCLFMGRHVKRHGVNPVLFLFSAQGQIPNLALSNDYSLQD